MSPEMVSLTGYGTGQDWWAVGIITYELICGYPPFSVNRQQWKEIIQNQKLFFPDQVINKIEISVDCKEFISQCLTKKADQRLGYNGGVEEILKHEWFEGVDIEAIKNKTMPA